MSRVAVATDAVFKQNKVFEVMNRANPGDCHAGTAGGGHGYAGSLRYPFGAGDNVLALALDNLLALAPKVVAFSAEVVLHVGACRLARAHV